jgi:hypothetical protein
MGGSRPVEGPLKVVGGIAAVAAVVVALTVFDGWDTFLDVTGLREFGPKEVYRAIDSQCDTMEARFPDDVVSCQPVPDFVRDLRRACAGEGPLPADHFLVGQPGSTRVLRGPCEQVPPG